MTEAPMSEQDALDLDSLNIPLEGAPEVSLLEVWASVLGNVTEVGAQPIPIAVAAKVVASWPFLTFQETAVYHTLYHQVLGELRDLLAALLIDHPEATGWTGEKDAAENHNLYRDVLVGWHNCLDTYEEDWRAASASSHIWVAVLADVRAFAFSNMGLSGHLDAIGFTLSDGEFLQAIEDSREERGE